MEDEIAASSVALTQAIVRGDVAAAATLYADDARLLAAAPDLIQGLAGIEAYWQTGIALGLSTLTLERQALDTLGGRILDAGRYALGFGCDAAGVTVEHGTYLTLHRRLGDSSWRRWLDVFDPDEEAGTGAHPDLAHTTQRSGGIQR
jgi:ketosteroid isomerase-like protein